MAKRILIVDDSASVRQVSNIALTRAGYEVIEATDGQDGLAKLAGKIHLIISDVNMPRMDGISFLKAVKAHPNYKFTPVIMLTTEAGETPTRTPRPPSRGRITPPRGRPGTRRRCGCRSRSCPARPARER